MLIITHRGLDPSKEKYFTESSFEAFTDHINRGFGLEFDLRLTKDKRIVVVHDGDLKRISQGKDTRKIEELTQAEICQSVFNDCHIVSFDILLSLIKEKSTKKSISAIHLKHHCQNSEFLEIFLEYVKGIDYEKFIIFDVTLETARFLKQRNRHLQLAASVAHEYDIERYNSVVNWTLMPLEIFLTNIDLFTWAWLDEWDLIGRDGGKKMLYTKEVFRSIQGVGVKIALVTPELHGTSPSLLGEESHADAKDKETLFRRIKEICMLRPDAVCTDYPDYIKTLL